MLQLQKIRNNQELLRDSMVPSFNSLFNSFFHEPGYASYMSAPADVVETDKEFNVSIALPGMKKEEIKIDLKENTLTISGERTFKKEEGKKYHMLETRYGKFSRSFSLPTQVKRDEISAEFNNGVLELTLPKSEVEQPKSIVIK